MTGRHIKFTVHSERAFEVVADSDGQLTITITAGDNQLDLCMDEDVFAALNEMVDDAVDSAAEDDDEDPEGAAENN